jgi:hypothetical protein
MIKDCELPRVSDMRTHGLKNRPRNDILVNILKYTMCTYILPCGGNKKARQGYP